MQKKLKGLWAPRSPYVKSPPPTVRLSYPSADSLAKTLGTLILLLLAALWPMTEISAQEAVEDTATATTETELKPCVATTERVEEQEPRIGGQIGDVEPCCVEGEDPCCGMECDDGNPCTTEYCQGGQCIVEPVDCSDDDPCTVDSCDQYGYCQHEYIECDDEDACTTDSCDGEGGCIHEPIDCDDSDACTHDSCSSSSGCINSPITCAADNDPCTDDYCDPARGCVSEPKNCDDEDSCTDDFCDSEGNCQHVPIDCDDGDPCTTEYCQDSQCFVEPVDCSDNDPCTIDSCDQYGYCQHDPIECDDEDPCTADSCDSEGNCVHTPVDCDDDDPCTIDSCDEYGYCQHEPKDCDDGDPCTIDSCDEEGVCQHEPKCDDGTICTDDYCDPETGECSYTPANEGECCEEDSDDCTKDICIDGVCSHPEKDDPPPVGTSVSFSISKKFNKHLKLPFVGKAIGFGTAFGVKAEAGSSTGKTCKTNGSVGGNASLNATFIGQGVSIDGEANGGWECEMPTECPEGCDNDKECNEDEKCCSAQGTGSLTVTRSFTKRFKVYVGSVYVNASVGGGLEGSASRTWPSCPHNHTIIGLGPTVNGSAGGGVEVCNRLVKWVCGCSQGRDPWTGRFTTSCASCSRCRPYASASVSGKAGFQVQWHVPDGGFSLTGGGNACLTIGGIEVGPVSFSGYKKCLNF